MATPSGGGSVVVGIVPKAQKISDLGGTSFGYGISFNIPVASLGGDFRSFADYYIKYNSCN